MNCDNATILLMRGDDVAHGPIPASTKYDAANRTVRVYSLTVLVEETGWYTPEVYFDNNLALVMDPVFIERGEWFNVRGGS